MCYQAEENSCLNMSVSVATDGTAQLLCSMSPHLLFECSIVPMCGSSKEGHGHWLSCSSTCCANENPGTYVNVRWVWWPLKQKAGFPSKLIRVCVCPHSHTFNHAPTHIQACIHTCIRTTQTHEKKEETPSNYISEHGTTISLKVPQILKVLLYD